METAAITGSFEDHGSVVLLEIDDGRMVAAEPRYADDVLSLMLENGDEAPVIAFESWQVLGRKR